MDREKVIITDLVRAVLAALTLFGFQLEIAPDDMDGIVVVGTALVAVYAWTSKRLRDRVTPVDDPVLTPPQAAKAYAKARDEVLDAELMSDGASGADR